MTVERLARICAGAIHENFQAHQDGFDQITRRAPERFNGRQWSRIRSDTTERLNLYAAVINGTEARLRILLREKKTDKSLWADAKADYARRISGRGDRELAKTFFNSVTRRILGTVGVDRQVEFVPDDHAPHLCMPTEAIFRTYPLTDAVASVIRKILADYRVFAFDGAVLEMSIPYIADRIAERLREFPGAAQTARIEMIRSVFFRGQGAYLIGRVVIAKQIVPLVMALLHPSRGVIVDALLLDVDGASIVFSYTRSAFNVDIDHLEQLVLFLRSIMPAKPEAELYSALGYFKHGKTVLYEDVCRHTAQCIDKSFCLSPGQRGMVMVVFDMAGHDMVVKLIRDRFDNPKRTTRAKVIEQYDFVFTHYRVGRLIEAHTFERLEFDRCWFSDDLLAHLIAEAGQTVHLEGDRVIIDHAYLERRVTPLNIYLKEASEAKAKAAVVDFGNAIKDLAFANIFAGDMLLKNFGVTRHGRVVFYDYDEIMPLTDCRFRKIPPARSYQEEMAAEPWYTVEKNDIFPEEFARFLGLSSGLRELFLSRHVDLLGPEFWMAVQEEIRSGSIRHIRPYHSRYRLPNVSA